jgi:hypothetical protein
VILEINMPKRCKPMVENKDRTNPAPKGQSYCRHEKQMKTLPRRGNLFVRKHITSLCPRETISL